MHKRGVTRKIIDFTRGASLAVMIRPVGFLELGRSVAFMNINEGRPFIGAPLIEWQKFPLFERGPGKLRVFSLGDLVLIVRRFSEDVEIPGDECKGGESERDQSQSDAELLD
jgi:hypothetical protein